MNMTIILPIRMKLGTSTVIRQEAPLVVQLIRVSSTKIQIQVYALIN